MAGMSTKNTERQVSPSETIVLTPCILENTTISTQNIASSHSSGVITHKIAEIIEPFAVLAVALYQHGVVLLHLTGAERIRAVDLLDNIEGFARQLGVGAPLP